MAIEKGDSSTIGSDGMTDASGIFYDCPGGQVMSHLTSRWGGLIILALAEADMRFHVLRQRIEGVGEKMLSQTLQTLIRDGFVTRSVKPTVPPEVSYGLTELGRAVAQPLAELVGFIHQRIEDVTAAQHAYDAEFGPSKQSAL